MGNLRKPENVKLFIGILCVSDHIFKETETLLIRRFGHIDLRSETREFNHTMYYHEEMGAPLYRSFLSFHRLMEPDRLPEVKIFTNSVEDRFRKDEIGGGRQINLDPGYMSHGCVVLATTKNYSHRVYLGSGIYAELTYRILGKRWEPFEWTYPDYRSKETVAFFGKVRACYLAQRKAFLQTGHDER